MPQPQQYERTNDFTERDGDDTNHAAINSEFDAAALTLEGLRDNLALIQRDDGELANLSVGADQLKPDAFAAVQASVNDAVLVATNAAQSALTSAITATQAAAEAGAAIAQVEAARVASLANANVANASAIAAAASAVTATNQATTATNQATVATNQAGISTAQATASAASAATATTQANNAAASAVTAATQAGISTAQATISTTQAGNSATSAANSLASATAAAAILDSFDDRYLGAKAAAPTLDNDGAALIVGALYFNSTSAMFFAWSGSAWIAAPSDSLFVGFTPAGMGAVATTVQAKLRESVSVKDFGAVGDGVTDDTAAIQAAIDYVAAIPQSTTYPYAVQTIFFPPGTYLISNPLECTIPNVFDGNGAIIKASASFTGVSIPIAAGGTLLSSAMFLFLSGDIDDISGVVQWKASIGPGITINCNFEAGPAIYIERMPYSRINCEVQGSATSGVEVGPYCWGLNLDEMVIENCTLHGVHFRKDSAVNGGSARNIIIWGEFLTGESGFLFDTDAQSNGFVIDGGFIEKVNYGILRSTGNGPLSINGVDFEQCQNQVIRVLGVANDAPVSVTNCFLHSIAAEKLFASNARIDVSGCTFFGASFDVGTASGGTVNVGDNTYLASGAVNAAPNASLQFNVSGAANRTTRNYLPTKNGSFASSYSLENYTYGDAPGLLSSGLTFLQAYAGGGAGQYVGISYWFTNEYLHISSPNVPTRIGVALGSEISGFEFRPMNDNRLSLGTPTARWTTVFATNGAISTSDAREKQQDRALSEAEKAVAVKLKASIKAFKFTHAVEKKGDDARTHFGVYAQELAEAFTSEGLDPNKYAMFCYDEWDARDPVTDDSGNVIEPAIEAGNRYGVRYDELLAFMIAAL